MADTISAVVLSIVTIILVACISGCTISEPVSITLEELETYTSVEQDETNITSSIDTTRSIKSRSDYQLDDYRTMSLSTNEINTYSQEKFIDPFDDYCDFRKNYNKTKALKNSKPEIPDKIQIDFNPDDSSPTNITGASSEQWDQFINQLCDERGYDSNHFLRDKGDVLSKIESDFYINPIGLISIWVWESDIGSSRIGRTKHNLAGIRSGGEYKYFESYTDCMLYHAELIKYKYIDEGLTSWESISGKYCPGNDKWSKCIKSTVCDYNEMLYKIMTR